MNCAEDWPRYRRRFAKASKAEAFQEGGEQFLLGRKVQLGIELLAMGLHRRRRDAEVISDGFAGMSFQDEESDFPLPRTEQPVPEAGKQMIDGPGLRAWPRGRKMRPQPPEDRGDQGVSLPQARNRCLVETALAADARQADLGQLVTGKVDGQDQLLQTFRPSMGAI